MTTRTDGADSPRRMTLLAELSGRLTASGDERLAVQELLDTLAPALGDFAFVHLLSSEGDVRVAGWTHREDARRAELGTHLAGGAADGPLRDILQRALAGETVSCGPEAPTPCADLGGRSALSVPLVSRGSTLGAATCVRQRQGVPTEEDASFARAAAGSVSLAIDNARLTRRAVQEAREADGARRDLDFHARLLDAVGEAVIATDVQGRITFWSDTAESLYGWRREEVLGRNIAEVTPSPGSRELATDIMALMSTGEGWSGEFRVRTKDGRPFTAQVTNSPIYHEGRLAGFIGVSRDVSGLVHARTDLEDARGTLDAVVRGAPWPFACLDLAGHVLHWSRGAEETFGWSSEEVLDRRDPSVEPDDWDDFVRSLSPLHDGDLPTLLARDVRRRTRAGQTLRATILHVPVRGGDESVTGSAGFVLESAPA